jgi:galactonate dehydratase
VRITAVEAHVCNARMRNWVFVRVRTDEPELWGWGEATLEWHTRAVVGAIEDLSELVVGEDPTRIEQVLSPRATPPAERPPVCTAPLPG